MAAPGTITWSRSVSTRMRTFTNWFGNSIALWFGNWARSLTVPVVLSMVLSTVMSVPCASTVVWARSQASTGSLSPDCRRGMTFGRLSSGMV
ncbi:hypothetical protein R77592_03947 [Ralstonia mannitolilytica]|nr:hypothetical protein R77592_03947 [Ralstonia mannitolilytica]